MIRALVMVILVACITGCPPPSDNCTPRSTRCSGNVAQLCTNAQRWEIVADCSSVMPPERQWTCCAIANGDHVCLPHDQCTSGTP